MTVRQSIKASDLEIKKRVLRGESVQAIARALNLSPRTIYTTIEKLVYVGEIRHVPGTKSPRLFEDNNTCKICTLSEPAGHEKNRYSNSPPITSAIGPPGKSVRAHITGAYVVRVVKAGNLNRFTDSDGYTIGGFFEPYKTGKNHSTTVYPGYVSINNEETKIQAFFNSASRVPSVINIYPQPRNVYYKTAKQVAKEEFTTQALLVQRVLINHGWQFDGPPSYNGVIHYGSIRPELLQYADRTQEEVGQAVHSDTSHGEPEIEIYDDSPTAQADLIILSELPERLRAMESTLFIATSSIEQLGTNQAQIVSVLAQLQSTPVTIMELLTKGPEMAPNNAYM